MHKSSASFIANLGAAAAQKHAEDKVQLALGDTPVASGSPEHVSGLADRMGHIGTNVIPGSVDLSGKALGYPAVAGGLMGAGAGAGGVAGGVAGALHGLLSPGEDEEGEERSRLIEALKRALQYGAVGTVAGAAAGPALLPGGLIGGLGAHALTGDYVDPDASVEDAIKGAADLGRAAARQMRKQGAGFGGMNQIPGEQEDPGYHYPVTGRASPGLSGPDSPGPWEMINFQRSRPPAPFNIARPPVGGYKRRRNMIENADRQNRGLGPGSDQPVEVDTTPYPLRVPTENIDPTEAVREYRAPGGTRADPDASVEDAIKDAAYLGRAAARQMRKQGAPLSQINKAVAAAAAPDLTQSMNLANVAGAGAGAARAAEAATPPASSMINPTPTGNLPNIYDQELYELNRPENQADSPDYRSGSALKPEIQAGFPPQWFRGMPKDTPSAGGGLNAEHSAIWRRSIGLPPFHEGDRPIYPDNNPVLPSPYDLNPGQEYPAVRDYPAVEEEGRRQLDAIQNRLYPPEVDEMGDRSDQFEIPKANQTHDRTGRLIDEPTPR